MERSPMLRQIDSIPYIMAELLAKIKSKAAHLVAIPDIAKARKIVMVGCGDSYCAAMAARQVFCEVTSKEIEVATAIDIARVYSRDSLICKNNDTIFVFISNSGSVSRIIEAAKRMRHFGAYCVAVTGSEQSPLFAIADASLTMEIPKLCAGPGMRSYTATLMALYAIAVELSTATGHQSSNRAVSLWGSLTELPLTIERQLVGWDKRAALLGARLKDSTSYEFIGCGTNYANSWFAYAKELEVAGRPASAINTEDWLHMNYFIKDVHATATFLFVDRNCPSYSRSKELEKVAVEMERPLVVVSNEDSTSDYHMSLPSMADSLLNAFVGYIPVSMVMGHIGMLLGEEDFRATKDHWTACINFATVAASEQLIIE